MLWKSSSHWSYWKKYFHQKTLRFGSRLLIPIYTRGVYANTLAGQTAAGELTPPHFRRAPARLLPHGVVASPRMARRRRPGLQKCRTWAAGERCRQPPWPCPDDGELGVALQDGLHGREPVTTLVQSFRTASMAVSHQKSTNLLLHFKHVGVCWLDLECWRDAMEFAWICCRDYHSSSTKRLSNLS